MKIIYAALAMLLFVGAFSQSAELSPNFGDGVKDQAAAWA
jgi:hypothetical protein